MFIWYWMPVGDSFLIRDGRTPVSTYPIIVGPCLAWTCLCTLLRSPWLHMCISCVVSGRYCFFGHLSPLAPTVFLLPVLASYLIPQVEGVEIGCLTEPKANWLSWMGWATGIWTPVLSLAGNLCWAPQVMCIVFCFDFNLIFFLVIFVVVCMVFVFITFERGLYSTSDYLELTVYPGWSWTHSKSLP